MSKGIRSQSVLAWGKCCGTEGQATGHHVEARVCAALLPLFRLDPHRCKWLLPKPQAVDESRGRPIRRGPSLIVGQQHHLQGVVHFLGTVLGAVQTLPQIHPRQGGGRGGGGGGGGGERGKAKPAETGPRHSQLVPHVTHRLVPGELASDAGAGPADAREAVVSHDDVSAA